MASEGEVVRRLLERALDDHKPVRLQVQGSCMAPLIRDGDWVRVRAGVSPRVGSVALALEDGELVCHRVLACGPDTLHLAGDRSRLVREHAWGSLLGVVREVERGGSAQRLGGWSARGLDRLLADLHHLAWRYRGRPAGRATGALRRLLLRTYDALTRTTPHRPGGAR